MIIRRAPPTIGANATVTQSVTTPVTRLHSQKKQKILKTKKKEQIKILVFCFLFFVFVCFILRQTIVSVSEKALPRAEQRSPYEPSRHSPPQRRTGPDARSPALVRGDQEECG